MRNERFSVIVETWILPSTPDGEDVLESKQTINNFYSHDSRKWLARHSWWALHNGRAVTTYPKTLES